MVNGIVNVGGPGNGNGGIVPPWLRDPMPWKPLVVGGPKGGGDVPVIQKEKTLYLG